MAYFRTFTSILSTMHSIEFDIQIDGETGRPRLIIPNTEMTKISDIEIKFFAVEITRALIQATVKANMIANNHSDYDKRMSEISLEIEKMSNVFALSVLEKIKGDDIDTFLDNLTFDIQVGTMDDLHNLNYNGIIYNDKIYKRVVGLKVKVLDNKRIYELKNGIDNNNWTDITS